jgi:hypothetical protein
MNYALMRIIHSSHNKKQVTNKVKRFRTTLHLSYNWFLSCIYHVLNFPSINFNFRKHVYVIFVVRFKKPSFKTYYNASIVRDTFVILVANTRLFQNVVAKNYFCILLGKTLLIFSVWIRIKQNKKPATHVQTK